MRNPVAIGFYPASKDELEKFIKELLSQKVEKIEAIAAIVPHAGYAYSGKTAGKVYASILTESRKFLIACPNHTGIGKRIALSTQNWLTPLGEVRVNKDFVDKIPVDEDAHLYEHSLEVQLPFLQVLFKNFEIIPLCLSNLEYSEIEELAETLAEGGIFYVASSDFIHFGPNYGYVPFDLTPEENVRKVEELDRKAIKFIEKLDARGFYNFVDENKLTICGKNPITLILLTAKKLGAKGGKLVAYSTSFDVHRDINFVTYAGILIY